MSSIGRPWDKQRCLKWSTYDVQPECREYEISFWKDRDGDLHFRWIAGAFVGVGLGFIALLLLGTLLFSGGGPTPKPGDRRTQVYECHSRSGLISTGKVMVPTTSTSCGWVTTSYNGDAA